ncbi:maleylpyruvate isomerase family mycothiol-dependent enzyme [Streptomyces aureocirculatus]|uniref:maleylpyruvate isomerase family mycothiol-dependent enzyme n=1 Tax=Streptomyces aureocirculatus TaxID=67275 RepID=UPI0004C574CC|nr:maleylpyruvate isomerase family mycothiol-dependent enzyme [Streptomyces aureocirculatus]
MTRLGYDRYRQEVAAQLGLFRETLVGADLTATVPTCPDWTLGELARHTGGAVRWVEAHVRTRATRHVPEADVPGFVGPGDDDPAGLDAWLAETADLIDAALRGASGDTAVWTWGAEHTAEFWARRMTHEVAVHRADAAIAAGVEYVVDPEVAVDAIDEWLEIVRYVQRNGLADKAGELRGGGRSIHLHAVDAGAAGAAVDAEWVVELAEEGVVWRRGHEKADVALRGPLTEVLLAFYRRRGLDSGRVEVLGDRELLEFWLERASFG